ncbi:transmembrane protein 272-like [Saccostrea cucullata]|uniref:transmembrane protein 272-like n=1 Tax=Saccostrea cuccullata TaxID=36930 RepID=UPI002ED49217
MSEKDAKLESAPTYTGEEPPSYDSIFGKIKHAKETSDGNVGFAKAAAGILCASVGCTVCLGVTMAIPIASIVIGALYLDDCPIQKYIPIYLVVAGAVGLCQNLFGMIQSICCKRSPDDEQEEQGAGAKLGSCINSLCGCFMFAWFIAGNVWVYSKYDVVQTTNSALTNYCHATPYYFAFWTITVAYIMVGVAILVSCCCCIACCFCAKKSDS